MRVFLILLAVAMVVVLGMVGLNCSEEPAESDTPPVTTKPLMHDDPTQATAPPKLISTATPQYPEDAREAGIEADVHVRALIDTLGTVTEVELVEPSGHKSLDDAALATTRECRFRPARKDGTAYSAWTVHTVEFRLGGSSKAIGSGSTASEDDYDTPPEITRRVDPVYPPQAKAAGTEGSVLFKLRVTEVGRITAVQILESPGEELGFDQAGFKAIRKYTFKPATKDGQPVAAWMTERIEFRLD